MSDKLPNERRRTVLAGLGGFALYGAVTSSVSAQEDDVAAEVTFTDRRTDGNSVVVDSYRMDDGGFIVIHDSSLLDGEVVGSIIGVSSYLEPGEGADLEVPLDEPLAADETLIAMPHRDTNDNQAYDFVATDGDEDGPYLDADDEAVVDSAEVTVDNGDDDGEVDDDEDDGAVDDGEDDGAVDDDEDDGEVDDGEDDGAVDDGEDDDEVDDGEDDDEVDDGEDDGAVDDGEDDDEVDDDDDGAVDDGEDDGAVDDDGAVGDDGAVDDDEDPDDDGPGFGPIAAVAGAGGVAAYAYRKLGFDSDPDTSD